MPSVPLRMRARSVFLRRDRDDDEGGSLGEDPLELEPEDDAGEAAAAAPEDGDPDELELLDGGAACMLGLLVLLLLLLLDEWRRRRCALADANNGDEEDSDSGLHCDCGCLHWIAAILNLMVRPDGALILQLA